jgi:hypothetical protein
VERIGGLLRNFTASIYTARRLRFRKAHKHSWTWQTNSWQRKRKVHRCKSRTSRPHASATFRFAFHHPNSHQFCCMPDQTPDSSRSACRIVGLVLLMLSPLCVGAAVVYSLAAPRLFSASTVFELARPETDAVRIPAVFQSAQSHYTTVMQGEPLARQVRLEPLDAPSKFRITATDPQPIRVMHSANGLTIMVRDALREGEADVPLPLLILAKAEMPGTPSHPDVTWTMKLGVYSAILCAIVGVTLRRMSRAHYEGMPKELGEE